MNSILADRIDEEAQEDIEGFGQLQERVGVDGVMRTSRYRTLRAAENNGYRILCSC